MSGFTNTLILLLFGLIVYVLKSLDSAVLSVDPNMTRNRSSFMTCTTTTQITGGVLFYTNNDISKGGCLLVGSACSSSVPGYSVTQNVSSRTTTLNIASVDCTRETGSWYCRHGSDQSSKVNIGCDTVKYPPTITSVPANKDVSENTPININCGGGSSPGILLPSYMWTGPDGYRRDQAVLDRTVTRTQGGQYSCTATNTAGSDTTQVAIKVQYPPTITSVASNKDVTENTSPNIDCSSNITPGYPTSTSYRWTGPGGYSETGPVLDRNVTRTQGGQYTCTATNAAGLSDTAQVNTNVRYPPDVRVDTQGPPTCRPYIVYVDQQNVQLTCQVIASNPGVTSYRWKQDSSVISSITGSVLIIRSVSRSSGGSYTCQGNNGIPTSANSQPVELVVQYGPSVSLPTSTQTVTEGRTLTVNYTVDSNPTASSVTWTKKDDNSFRQESTTLTIPSIQRSQTRTYVCTATNTLSPCGLAPIQRTGTDEVSVDVQYKSTIISLTLNSASGSVTVDESEFLNLTCQVDSNPGSTIRLMNGSQALRRADNSLSASHSWVAQCRQRGNYSCTVNNIIGAAVNNIIKLAVKCSPRKDETFTLQHHYFSSVGSNVTMSVPVLAYPVPTFTWSRMSSTSQNLTGSLVHVSDISFTAHLKLKYLQQKDFGDYNVTVENGVGELVLFTLTIVPEGPPKMPSNLTVTSNGAYSLLAAWKQEFNGGAEQNFTVEYSKDKLAWIIAGTKEESRNEEYLQLKISALEASTTYYVRVIARNRYGQKNYTQSVAGSTKEAEKTTEPSSSNIGVIVGATVGCVLILVIVAGIVVYLVRKGFRCVMLTPDMEAVKKRSNHDASRNIHMDDQATQSTGSRANIVTSQNPYSELNREGDRQTYTELKTYVNIEQGTESAPTNTYESFQEKNQVPYENMKIHTYANTGAQQTVPNYDSVEAM